MKNISAVILAMLTLCALAMVMCSCSQAFEETGNKIVNKAQSYLSEEFTYDGEVSEAGDKLLEKAESYAKEEFTYDSDSKSAASKLISDAKDYLENEFGLD